MILKLASMSPSSSLSGRAKAQNITFVHEHYTMHWTHSVANAKPMFLGIGIGVS